MKVADILLTVLLAAGAFAYLVRLQPEAVSSEATVRASAEYREWLSAAEDELAREDDGDRLEAVLGPACLMEGKEVLRVDTAVVESTELAPSGGARGYAFAWFDVDSSTQSVIKYTDNPCQ